MRLLFIIFTFLCSFEVYSKELFVLEQKNIGVTGGYPLNSHVYQKEDKWGRIAIDDLVSNKKQFDPLNEKPFHIGYTNSYYWHRVSIKNNEENREWSIYARNPMLLDSAIYIVKDNKIISENLIGNEIPVEQRKRKTFSAVADFKLEKGETLDIYARLKSPNQIDTTFIVYSKSADELRSNVILGVLWFSYGVVIGLFLYNLFLYVSTREINYAYYCLFVFCSFLILMLLNGTIDFYLPQPFGVWSRRCFFIGTSSILSAGWFSYNFLQVKKNFPKYYKYVLSHIYLGIIVSVAAFFNTIPQFGHIVDFYFFATFFIFIGMGFILFMRGVKAARYFFVGWLGLGLSASFFLLGTHRVIPENFFTYFSINIGMSFEMLVMSIGLADLINQLKRDLVDTLQESNEKLEKRVEERAQIIMEQQHQLIHSAKMASLGEMAAGTAHEINNPLAIIKGNTKRLEREVASKDVDLDKLQMAIEKINLTTDRIAKIVKGLLTFSRADNMESEMEEVSVKHILDEVFDLCIERMQSGGIDFQIVPADPDLKVSCFPMQIAQVILNFIHNSYDAIENTDDPWINVETATDSEYLYFYVTDSGKGIPPEIQEKILQPFFTTKPEGKGTGLGLSISIGIIKDHGGEVLINNECENTQFMVKLPLSEPLENEAEQEKRPLQ